MSFTIDFTEINRVIGLLENSKEVIYDSTKKIYIVDGDEQIEERFFLETFSKFSHFINVISNTLLSKKTDNVQSIEIHTNVV